MTTLVDFPVKPEARPYLDAFAECASEPQWLRRARRASLNRFAEQGFPSRHSEAWRYLDLRDLQEKPLLPVAPHRLDAAIRGQLDSLDLLAGAHRLVFVDGCFSPVLSARDGLPDGAWLGPISAAIVARPELVRDALDDRVDGAFAALNAAFFADGFVLDVAPGVVLDRPIQIIHFAATGGSAHTRSLVNLGAGSRATLVETYAGEGGAYWRNDVVDVRLGDGAALDRTVLVEEGGEAVHLSDTQAVLGAGARFSSFALLLAGRTVRHEIAVTMAGEGAHCTLDGAFVVGGQDEANIVTAVDHRAPGGTTRELFKGVAAGRGHGAFQGKIGVREGAQQTDAKQTSRNLILGRRATIDTKPELEIFADDVKCAHGASVGDLDEAALFYLRARGIATDEARRLLVEGFVREAVERVGDPAVRERLLSRLAVRLAQLETE
ncbi:MAG TPA: Fe-S cluster assembly protein SufD [Stellaceae bacterium]|nr:Fe-S cluster assembly protein SufD [Stellaceae bacterium]